jgi:hypothetical protein
MYKGIPFSPQVALADGIGAGDTTIPVTDISAFPDAPNLATIGTDEDGETILYTAKTTDSLSGCTRGVEGTAKAWPSGTTIARNFTNKDFDALQKNIQEAKKQADQGVNDAATAKSAADAAKGAADTAKAQADKGVNDAATAKSTADAAQSTANAAGTAAGNAQNAADNAQSAADTHAANKQNPHGVTASQVGAAAASHKHGNLTTDGKLGSAANLPVFTGTGGAIQTETAVSAAAKLGRGYGACSTAAATKAKAVTLSGFTLVTGAIVGVKFSYDNTAAAPTLNVNSTGAKPIYYKGEAVAAGLLKAGYVYLFQYNGAQYELLNPVAQGGGGFYPSIVVTAPTGSTVTATDGNTSLVGTEVSGKWTFQIPAYGVWSITATLNGQTASTSVSVTEVKQYTVTLTYFSATISVTYPAGSTCTCSNGADTLTAPNTTGSYTFTVPRTGTWTVKSTNGVDTAQQAVSITANGQSTSVTLSYKPTASTSPKSGVNYTPGISGLTAEKMSLYGEAISRNSAITNTTSTVYIDDGASHYKISTGDKISIAINGTAYEFRILGFNHDTLTTSTAYGSATATGKAGMTLQMVNCLAATAKMNSSNTNSGGWESCAMRTSNMATYLSQLTSAWQSVVKQVNKLSSAGSQSTTIKTTADKLFLLSEVEIFGSTTYSVSGEGTQYAYCKANNTASDRVKTVNGSASYWWERSPYASSSTYFCSVASIGGASSSNASYSIGVAFGFCV